MTDLTIAVTTTGPVPDNQCALKDAVLVAAAAGISDPAQVVALAEQFRTFLVGTVTPPGPAAPQAQAQPGQPTQPAADPGLAEPLQHVEPVLSQPVDPGAQPGAVPPA